MKEDLVELLAQVIGRLPVGPGHIGTEGDRHADAVLGGLEVGSKDLLALCQPGQGHGDAVLLGLQHVEWDGAGVVGFHQLAALSLQLLRFLLEGRLLGFVIGATAAKLLEE